MVMHRSDSDMNSATNNFHPVSNPGQVLRMLHPLDAPASTGPDPQSTIRARNCPRRQSKANLKIHADLENDETRLDDFHLDQPPPHQVEQLIGHLREQRKELAQREADLQSEVYEWEKEVMAREGGLRRRQSEVEQQLSQINRQQEQLIRLQQSVIDSQEAIRAVVERLVEDCQIEDQRIRLQELKDAISERIADNFQAWEEMLQTLRG
jgi:chromosome segregation ATPase